MDHTRYPINIPAEILRRAESANNKLIPEKSKERYNKELELLQYWQKSNGVEGINENILMAYIDELSEKFAPSSRYTKISMLKSCLIAKENIDINKYSKINAYLRRNSVGYSPKKSKVLNRQQILKFLKEAPDNDWLLEKVVFIFGFLGACRRAELTYLKVQQIEDRGSVIIVNIPETKNYKARLFHIIEENELCGMTLYRKYAGLRPKEIVHDRFFLNYKRGRCTVQPVGINTIGSIPKKIAKFLKLKDAHLYTGHCLRRSSATELVDGGGDITSLKRLGGWKSTTVAETYIEDGSISRNNICKILSMPSTSTSKETEIEHLEGVSDVTIENVKSVVQVESGGQGNKRQTSGCINLFNCTITNFYNN